MQSAGDNYWRSKCFCSIIMLCVSFTWQIIKHTRDQITSDRKSKGVWSNCILWIPFILSGSLNECWLHTSDASVITTWRFGLRAPVVPRNYDVINVAFSEWQFLSYRSGGEKLVRYQENSSCVIMSVILMTTLFYKALTLHGEIWCWTLLGLKRLILGMKEGREIRHQKFIVYFTVLERQLVINKG